MIPKIIHYCWLSDDPMPQKSVEYIKSWHDLLHDYDFILWNRKKFDIESVCWVKEAFDKKKYAFAADYIRLFAVYNYGGFYLDSDVELKKTFDDLLNRKLVIGYENKGRYGIEAGCFGAERGHAFIEKCLSYYKDKHFVNDDDSFNTKTLPMIMYDAITDDLKKNIFSYDFFTAKSQELGIVEVSPNTYAIHHFAGTWLTDFEKAVQCATAQVYSKYRCKIISKIVLILLIVLFRFKYDGFLTSVKYYLKKYMNPQKTVDAIKEIGGFFRRKNG